MELNREILRYFQSVERGLPAGLNPDVSIRPVEIVDVDEAYAAFEESKTEIGNWMNWPHDQTKESVLLFSYFRLTW